LLTVRGPTSFEDLRTVDGILYTTYYEAAQKRELVESNEMWENTARDAMNAYRTLRQRTIWMANFLWNIKPSDPMEIIKQNLKFLSPLSAMTDDQRKQFVLRNLELYFRNMGIQSKIHPNGPGTAGEQVGLEWIDMSNQLLTDRDMLRVMLISLLS
jgi:hypothetical protein